MGSRRSHWATYLYMSSRARAANTAAGKEREASGNRKNRVVRARLSGGILTKGEGDSRRKGERLRQTNLALRELHGISVRTPTHGSEAMNACMLSRM